MKKLITLLAVLLFGTASVFAQSAWEVKVNWSYSPNTDCSPPDLPSQNYGIVIELEIKDVANGNTVITDYPTLNFEDLDDLTTTFSSAQAKVEDYCDDYHDNTPLFTVTATVAFIELTTEVVYCSQKDVFSGYSCNDFYNGVLVEVIFD